MADKKNGRSSVKRAFLALALLSVGLFGCFSALTPSVEEMEKAEQERAADPTSGATYACREFIKQVLISPSSAEWGHWSAWPRELQEDGTVRVKATIDASNTLGTLIRQQFSCVVRKSDGQWYLEDLNEMQ